MPLPPGGPVVLVTEGAAPGFAAAGPTVVLTGVDGSHTIVVHTFSVVSHARGRPGSRPGPSRLIRIIVHISCLFSPPPRSRRWATHAPHLERRQCIGRDHPARLAAQHRRRVDGP